jgi:hypothetical protein
MTFTEAAIWVLRLANKPLHFKEITDVAIEQSLLSHVGKNPEVTMGARLSAQVKKNEKDNPLTRVKPGVFALSDWDDKTIASGLANRTPALELVRKAEEKRAQDSSAEEKQDVQAPESEPGDTSGESASKDELSTASTAVGEEGDGEQGTEPSDDTPQPSPSVAPPPDDEEIHRAQLSAAATDLFEPEDDDDQPIFGSPAREEPEDEPAEGRRRRRRRRGKRRDGDSDEGEDDLPAYTVSDAPSDEVLAEVLDESAPVAFGGGGDSSVGLSGQLIQALSKYDASRGPVSAQGLADALKKSFSSDRSLSGAGVLAAAAAENYAREKQGEAPLFRIAGSKVGLAAWSFDKRGSDRLAALGRLSQEIRGSTQKTLSDQIGKLGQRALGELVLVLLDRMGLVKLSSVKRPGTHGAELHFSARAPQAAYGLFPGQDPKASGVAVAVCVRRDGKDVGRERVTELRGALHHYDGAAQGWLITSGQILSGAREEACCSGASPMVLLGRTELSELCLVHGVGVRVHRVEVPLPDVALLDSLSAR